MQDEESRAEMLKEDLQVDFQNEDACGARYNTWLT